MKYAIIALALFAVVHAASEVGQFVPRAVYTLDSEGHQSAVHPVSARLLRRLRRQVFSSSSSSSSSSSTNSNGEVVYNQANTVQNPDGTATFQQSSHHIPAQVDFASRFGDDSPTSGVSGVSGVQSAGAGFGTQSSTGQYNSGQYSGSNTAGTGSARPHHHFTSVSGTVDAQGHVQQLLTTGYINSKGEVVQKKTTTTN
ncbi:hypothetical protein KR044_010687 [Drosophila immigrans]|nr:hypothetical protein KR044_010687 [Drosophila immigrans]